jgi:hypothetical protein
MSTRFCDVGNSGIRAYGVNMGVYQHKSKLEPAPNLEVFAPTRRQPAPTSQPHGHTSSANRRKPESSKTRPTSPQSVSESLSALKHTATDHPGDRRFSDHLSNVSIHELNPSEQLDPQRQKITHAITRLPSWLISMVLHLSLILAFAVVTFGVQATPTMVLQLSESPADLLDDMAMEITLDDEQIEEPTDSDFSVADEELIEPQAVSVEMLEDFSEADALMSSVNSGDQLFGEDSDSGGSDANDAGTSGSDGSGASFYGVESQGNRFVFVIDCSGSMDSEYRWISAIKELKRSIGELDQSQSFLIYLYNRDTWAMLGANLFQAELLPADDDTKIRVTRWLDRFSPRSDTYPGGALKLALLQKPDAVFFLSDGELMDNTVQWLRAWNPKGNNSAETYSLVDQIPIHTIFLGSGTGRLTMEVIAKQNSGQFRWAR